jgi:hypothetical protein
LHRFAAGTAKAFQRGVAEGRRTVVIEPLDRGQRLGNNWGKPTTVVELRGADPTCARARHFRAVA